MRLFKSKAEKEQEKKQIVKKSMREMEKRIVKLRAQEAKYIDAAKLAMKEALPEQVNLARTALKLTIAERKRTYKMLLNAEIIYQMKDMTKMTGEFLNAVRVLSKEIVEHTGQNMNKISLELDKAMGRVGMMADDLEDLLDEAQTNTSDLDAENNAISDAEIDKIIYGGEKVTDAELDKELEELKKKLQ